MKHLIVREVDKDTVKQENGMIHPEGFGVMLCTSGKGTMTYGDRAYVLERNVLVLFMSYSVIHIEQERGDIKGLLLEADTETTLQLLADVPMDKRLSIVQHPCVKLSDGQEDVIRQMFGIMVEKARIIDASPDDNATGKRILAYLSHAASLEILQAYFNADKLIGSPMKRNNIVYNRFIESVCAKCNAQRSVAHYAKEQNISVGHFSSVVRAVSGHTPMYWIELYTITAIKRLLRESAQSIKEIADLMSFPDQSTFGRYFKQREGVSPMEYRTRFRFRV